GFVVEVAEARGHADHLGVARSGFLKVVKYLEHAVGKRGVGRELAVGSGVENLLLGFLLKVVVIIHAIVGLGGLLRAHVDDLSLGGFLFHDERVGRKIGHGIFRSHELGDIGGA